MQCTCSEVKKILFLIQIKNYLAAKKRQKNRNKYLWYFMISGSTVEQLRALDLKKSTPGVFNIHIALHTIKMPFNLRI